MDEKLFECGVCLELCRECVNCTKCHQILCKSHVSSLNSCPVCRDAPFQFQENIALQRIIRDLKMRMGITTPPPSPREPGGPCGDAVTERSIEATIAADPTNASPEAPPAEVQPRFGEKVPCGGRREGQFRKVPSDEHHNNMREHVRSCTHVDCRHVWSGPWGSFIGGADGSTHFDLTECPEGKRMNFLIGWNYDDPRL